MNNGKRELFIDYLRIAATFAVVLIHTISGVMDNTDMSAYLTEQKVFLVLLDSICWCVPVFIMISGYLFLNPEKEVTGRMMISKYAMRIVMALFLFGVPYAMIELYVKEGQLSFGMIGRGIEMVLRGQTWSHMWYLYLVLILYLLTPVIRFILRTVPDSVIFGLMGVIVFFCSIAVWLKKREVFPNIWALPEEGIYLFYYLCGYYFRIFGGRNPQLISAKAKKIIKELCPIVLIGIVLYNYISRFAGNVWQRMAYAYPVTVVLALVLFAWVRLIGTQKDSKEVEADETNKNTGFAVRFAKLTFTIYLIHPVFLNVYYKFLHITPLDYPLWWSLPTAFMATILPSIAGAWLLYQIPPLRKWVL